MNLKTLFLAFFVMIPVTTAFSQPESMAKDFVQKLSDGKFSEAVALFDPAMTAALPEPKLQQTWNGLTRQVGPFQKQLGVRQQSAGLNTLVFVPCQFERAVLDCKIAFNASNQISSLFFVPHQPQPSQQAQPALPGYVDKSTFREKEVQIGSDPWVLPGTLSIPNTEDPVAAVILVHGSGPQDRDETIGPNKPFRDIAWGLASNGIAVLRYEKRTSNHGAQMAAMLDTLTVQEETIDDVLFAVATLKNEQAINPQRIFVLGHSLGGMLVPRIAQQDKQAAGFIIMAGSTLPLEDSIVNQYTYILGLDGQIDKNEKQQLDAIKQQAALIKSKDLRLSSNPVLGLQAAYWLDLRGYDPAKEAAKIERPILILQGERDYQVTMEDFRRWKTALNDQDNVQYRLYPDLNHLFIIGEGKSTPAEYEKPGHVSETVIKDLVRWLSDR